MDKIKKYKDGIFELSSKIGINEREKYLKNKLNKDIIIPSLFIVISLSSVIYSLFFNQKFYEICAFFFIISLFYSLLINDVLKSFNSTYFKDRKLNNDINNGNIESVIVFKKSNTIRKSKLVDFFMKSLDEYMLNKKNTEELVNILKECDISSYTKDRLIQKYFHAEGISLGNSIKIIDEIEEYLFYQKKSIAKEKLLESFDLKQ